MATLMEQLTKTVEGMRLYQQERAIQEWTDMICEIMQFTGVDRPELARRLGKTTTYITKMLDGRTTMTIRMISDVFLALEHAVHFRADRLNDEALQS